MNRTKATPDCHDDEPRRRALRLSGLYGLDHVEVEVEADRVSLRLYFIGRLPEDRLTASNVRLDGAGRAVRAVAVKREKQAPVEDARLDQFLRITLDREGDRAPYTLRLVEAGFDGRPTEQPLADLDPRHAQLTVNFRADGPAYLDCATPRACPAGRSVEPATNYLAKDYASFRQLIFDRLALVMPQWTERLVPDMGVALVEVLAYVGDHLSYYQDAVATEAYLHTARKRISVRRHARLVDYSVHEGCNARAWVCVEVWGREPDAAVVLRPNQRFIAAGADDSDNSSGGGGAGDDPAGRGPLGEVFEPMGPGPVNLYAAHNAIRIYTWGERQCCLPAGTTSATLLNESVGDEWDTGQTRTCWVAGDLAESAARGGGDKPAVDWLAEPHPRGRALALDRTLRVGQVLIFEEVCGPGTGEAADADRSRRHAVRLTRVTRDRDRAYDPPVPLVRVEWSGEDALPFPLCVSAVVAAKDCRLVRDVSVARGNVVLVDHGRTEYDGDLGTAPSPPPGEPSCDAEGRPRPGPSPAVPFRPTLDDAPLTHRAPSTDAAAVARQQARALAELIAWAGTMPEETWLKLHKKEQVPLIELSRAVNLLGLPAEVATSPKVISFFGNKVGAAGQEEALATLLAARDEGAESLRLMRGYLRQTRDGQPLGRDDLQRLRELFTLWDATMVGNADAADDPLPRLGLRPGLLAGPARDAIRQDPRAAVPCVCLVEDPPAADGEAALAGSVGWAGRQRELYHEWCGDGHAGDGAQPAACGNDSEAAAAGANAGPGARPETLWRPVGDLLASGASDRHFVAEVDEGGVAHLRFGDGDMGRVPDPGTHFRAVHRVGNGAAGNVGPESISRLVPRDARVRRVRNPLPAAGGVDPEPLGEVRAAAPTAFRRKPLRAVTADDYARLAEQHPDVQRAAAELRWTGSRQEVRVAIDPRGSASPGNALLAELLDVLSRYRRIGHDLRVVPAGYVPLEVELEVELDPGAQRGHVKAALRDRLGSRRFAAAAGVEPGFFHADRLTFGGAIHLSRIVTAAQGVPGVRSVAVTKLRRADRPQAREIVEGILRIGPLEVARLDNDPAFPANGRLNLIMRGGR